MIIRWGSHQDLSFLQPLEVHVHPSRVVAALEQQRVLLADDQETTIGWLRFSWFWESIPFMDMLFILKAYRRQGVGRMLVQHWEQEMRNQGHSRVMTSTRADEEAQHFYRRLGYEDAGCLLFPTEPTELLFHKRI